MPYAANVCLNVPNNNNNKSWEIEWMLAFLENYTEGFDFTASMLFHSTTV